MRQSAAMNNNNCQFSFDVEADGPAPGLYSMVSIGIVRLDDLSQTFYATLKPISEKWIPEALAVSKFSREQCLGFEDPQKVMQDLDAWVSSQCSGRAVMWSDNPGFDWQFLNYYCHRYLGKNPFGHSCRRIGDFFAGLQGDPTQSQGWKKLRGERHTHNALDDARGNARAIGKILAQARQRRAAQARSRP
jgi:DNA polymerase III epsilon subunit-like protein